MIRPFFSKKIRFIARESNTVSINNKADKYPKVNDFLYKRIYKNFDLIIAQAKFMRDDLVENFGIKSSKMVVIYNPVDSENVMKKSKELDVALPEKFNLLAVGKLNPQKGFDMLLNIVSKLDDSYHLTILGEGKDKQELESQIATLGLEDRVSMVGFCDNPYTYMGKADLFVLSSRFEGLPNVVLEANSCGLPVVAFDSAGGTGEIINDGENGFLVEAFDEDMYAKCIEKARDYKFDKDKIIENTKRDFSVKKIIKEYERVFLSN